MNENIFEFTKENLEKANELVSHYPEGRQKSAIIAILDLAQRQNQGYLTREAMEFVSRFLSIAPIRVYEVASFYSMFNLKPIGKFLLQICTTTPCALRGAEKILEACKKYLGVSVNQTTIDRFFTLKEVECLGACVNAPMVQINDDYYEDLDSEKIVEILEMLSKGKMPKTGSQINRHSSEPIDLERGKI